MKSNSRRNKQKGSERKIARGSAAKVLVISEASTGTIGTTIVPNITIRKNTDTKGNPEGTNAIIVMDHDTVENADDRVLKALRAVKIVRVAIMARPLLMALQPTY